jgi:predicted dehydrogenase
MSERKLVRVGVVGGGVWGRHHLTAARQLEHEGFAVLTSMAAHSKKTADTYAKSYGIEGYTDFREMIDKEKLDLVAVATPDHLHREVTMYALEHNCHVLVEKPLDLTSSGCQDMITLAENNKCLLMVDFHKRYDPYMIDIRRRILDGEIGNPYYGYFYMEDKISVPLQNLSKWAEESSPFWFVGVHKVDLLRWITSMEIVQVSAEGYRGTLEKNGINALDAVSARLLLDGGFSCTIDVSWVIPDGFESVVNQGVRIIGSEGLIEVDTQDRGLRICSDEYGMLAVNKFAYHSTENLQGYEEVSGYYVDPIKDFIRKVFFYLNGGDYDRLSGSFPTGTDGMIATKVAEAVEESIRTNKTIKL